MKRKNNKKSDKRELISLLRNRIKALESARQNYAQNFNLAKNVRIANTVAVENDLETLKELLTALTKISSCI